MAVLSKPLVGLIPFPPNSRSSFRPQSRPLLLLHPSKRISYPTLKCSASPLTNTARQLITSTGFGKNFPVRVSPRATLAAAALLVVVVVSTKFFQKVASTCSCYFPLVKAAIKAKRCELMTKGLKAYVDNQADPDLKCKLRVVLCVFECLVIIGKAISEMMTKMGGEVKIDSTAAGNSDSTAPAVTDSTAPADSDGTGTNSDQKT